MARVKLLRQSVEDYGKKIAEYNKNLGGLNDQYKGEYDAYKEGVDVFNKYVDAVKNKTPIYNSLGMPEVSYVYSEGKLYVPNNSSYLSGFAEGSEYPESGLSTWEQMQNERKAAAAEQGIPYYGRQESGQPLYGIDNPNLPQPGTPEYDAEVAKMQAEWDRNERLSKNGALRYIKEGYGNYTPVYSAPTAPTAYEQPPPPREPNLTVGNIREMKNPGRDMAGLQMAANMGIIGKSQLADNERSKVSAFADPDDPNNLKDAGILARTIGGQL